MGFDVQVKTGQGYLPGARLIAVKGKEEIDVAIKASQQRALSFTWQPDKGWRTLRSVDLVVAAVPGEEDDGGADVFGFKRKALERKFEQARAALESGKRYAGFNTPIFIPIDAVSRKNLGHDVVNLKKLAIWSVHLTAQQAAELSERMQEDYIDQFRRRFAAENGIDVGQVMISIVGKPK
jgi:hypothetical protein